jgi:hypothetical protein
MNYAVEMGSDAMTYIQSFINWFSHSKDNKGGYIYTQQGDLISLLLFFLNKENRLKNKRRLMRSPCCLCVCMCIPPDNFRTPVLDFMKLGYAYHNS